MELTSFLSAISERLIPFESLFWVIEKERTETANSLSKMKFQHLVHSMPILKHHMKLFLVTMVYLKKSNREGRNKGSITNLFILTDFLLSLVLTLLTFCGQIIYCIILINGNWGGKINYIVQGIAWWFVLLDI